MKKIFLFCVAAVLLASVLVIGAFAVYGDFNEDSSVDGIDAVMLAQYLADWEIEYTSAGKKNADVYYDGVINAADAVKLAQYLAGWNVKLGPKGGDVEIEADDMFDDETTSPEDPGSSDPSPIELRAMTFNIQAEDVSGRTASSRIGSLLSVLEVISPDVVMIQEADAKWRECLTNSATGVASVGYAYKHADINDNRYSLENIGVAYNTSKYTLVRDGLEYFDDYAGTEYQPTASHFGIFWVLLKENSSERKFIVASTHWQYNSGVDASWANTVRRYQANETVTVLDKLKTDYNCPIILGGDFNASTTDDYKAFNKFLADAGVSQSVIADEDYCMRPLETKTTFVPTKCIEGVKTDEKVIQVSRKWIDYIFIDKEKSSAKFCGCMTYSDYDISPSPSDHDPVYADIVLS